MYVGVVANIHQVAVEPVRAHHLDHWLYRCPARVCRAGAHERFAHEQQILLELRSADICGWLLGSSAGIAGGGKAPRRLYARQHERELEPQWLVRVTAAVRF